MSPKLLLRSMVYHVLYYSYVRSRLNRTVTTTIGGRPFVVDPSVFHPRFFFSSKIFVDFVRTLDLDGKTILDMGTGSGILAVFAALQGAIVTAVDKNPAAVRCAHENCTRNNVAHRVRTLQGDLFSPFSNGERFDYILFNPPFYAQEPSSVADIAWKAGKDFRLLVPFIRDARRHLRPDGTIFLIISSDVAVDVLLDLFRAEGFHFRVCLKRNLLLERMMIYEFAARLGT